uniref:C3H1-type domain-containing protein n=1 Tax=Paramormyrops kingsleyae TaxID=1676925 RepID=A0A3B3QD07_9TELE
MSTKEVSAFITKLLCRSRGCMEYSELHRAVRQRYSLSDQDLLAFLGDTSRFIVTGDSSQSGVAGPQPGAASRVIAKTSVRLCQMHECDGRACQNLHLCKYLVCGQCGRGKKCKYSHKVHSSHNSNILTEEGLQDLDQLELFQLLLQNDNWLLPDICSHYNLGSDKHGSCTYKKKCFKLHICKFFLQGDCIFANNCRRAHRFDESSIMILEKRCFKVDLNSQRVLYEIYKNRFMITADFEKAAGKSFCVIPGPLKCEGAKTWTVYGFPRTGLGNPSLKDALMLAVFLSSFPVFIFGSHVHLQKVGGLNHHHPP